jgi:hypothetical protein
VGRYLSRVAIMLDPRDSVASGFLAAYEKAAKSPGISTQLVEVTTSDGIEQAFSAIAQDGFDGAALAAPMLLNQRVRVGAAALAHTRFKLVINQRTEGFRPDHSPVAADHRRRGDRLMSPLGTFATCRLHRALSEFESKAEEIYSH